MAKRRRWGHHGKRVKEEPVGIAGVGWWVAENVLPAAELAALAGVAPDVITDHIGLQTKRIAGPDDHPSDMAARAAAHAFERTGVEPDEIDLVIFCGEGPADWNGWSPAASLQHRLGIHHAFAFDLHNACCAANASMTVAAGLMHRDPDVRTAMVLTAVRFSDLVDYSTNASHGFWTFADGGTATIVRRDEPSNTILAYAEVTEPSLADQVRIPLGGTRMPYTADIDPDDLAHLARYQIDDADAFDDVLQRIYIDKYVEVAELALRRCGLRSADIDVLLTNQLPVHLMDRIHERLGVPTDRTMRSIDTVGHIGPGDGPMNLGRALDAGVITPGDTVVMASSGIGCSWASTVIQF